MSINLTFDLQRFENQTTERKLDLSKLTYDATKVYIHVGDVGDDEKTYAATLKNDSTNAIGMVNSDGSITLNDGYVEKIKATEGLSTANPLALVVANGMKVSGATELAYFIVKDGTGTGEDVVLSGIDGDAQQFSFTVKNGELTTTAKVLHLVEGAVTVATTEKTASPKILLNDDRLASDAAGWENTKLLLSEPSGDTTASVTFTGAATSVVLTSSFMTEEKDTTCSVKIGTKGVTFSCEVSGGKPAAKTVDLANDGSTVEIGGQTFKNTGTVPMTVSMDRVVTISEGTLKGTYAMDDAGTITKTIENVTYTYTEKDGADFFENIAGNASVVNDASLWNTNEKFALASAKYYIDNYGVRKEIPTSGEKEAATYTVVGKEGDWKLLEGTVNAPADYNKIGTVTFLNGVLKTAAFEADATTITTVFRQASGIPVIEVGSAVVSGYKKDVAYQNGSVIISPSADGGATTNDTFTLTVASNVGTLTLGQTGTGDDASNTGFKAATTFNVYAGNLSISADQIVANEAGKLKGFSLNDALGSDEGDKLKAAGVLGDATVTVTGCSATAVTIGGKAYTLTEGDGGDGIPFTVKMKDESGAYVAAPALTFALNKEGEKVALPANGGVTDTYSVEELSNTGLLVKQSTVDTTSTFTVYGDIAPLTTGATVTAAEGGSIVSKVYGSDGEVYAGEIATAYTKISSMTLTVTDLDAGKASYFGTGDEVTVNSSGNAATAYSRGIYKTVGGTSGVVLKAGYAYNSASTLTLNVVDFSGLAKDVTFSVDESAVNDKLADATFKSAKSSFTVGQADLSKLQVTGIDTGDDSNVDYVEVAGEVTVTLVTGDSPAVTDHVIELTEDSAAVLKNAAANKKAAATINGLQYSIESAGANDTATVSVSDYMSTVEHTAIVTADAVSVKIADGSGGDEKTFSLTGSGNQIKVVESGGDGTLTSCELWKGTALLSSDTGAVASIATKLGDNSAATLTVSDGDATEGKYATASVTVADGKITEVQMGGTVAGTLAVAGDNENLSYALSVDARLVNGVPHIVANEKADTGRLCLVEGSATLAGGGVIYVADETDTKNCTVIKNTGSGTMTVAATGTGYTIQMGEGGVSRTFTIDGQAYSANLANDVWTLTPAAGSNITMSGDGEIKVDAISYGADGMTGTTASQLELNATTLANVTSDGVSYNLYGNVTTKEAVVTVKKLGTSSYTLTTVPGKYVAKGIAISGVSMIVNEVKNENDAKTKNVYTIGTGDSAPTIQRVDGNTASTFTTSAANVVEVTSGSYTATGTLDIGYTKGTVQSVFTLTNGTDAVSTVETASDGGVTLGEGATITAKADSTITLKGSSNAATARDLTLKANAVVTDVDGTAALTSGSEVVTTSDVSTTTYAQGTDAGYQVTYAPGPNTKDGVVVTVTSGTVSVTDLEGDETVTVVKTTSKGSEATTYSVVEESDGFHLVSVKDPDNASTRVYSGVVPDLSAADVLAQTYSAPGVWSSIGAMSAGSSGVERYFALENGVLAKDSAAVMEFEAGKTYLKVTSKYVAAEGSMAAHYNYTVDVATRDDANTDWKNPPATVADLDLTEVPYTGSGKLELGTTKDQITKAKFAVDATTGSETGTVILARVTDSVLSGDDTVVTYTPSEDSTVAVDAKGMIRSIEYNEKGTIAVTSGSGSYEYSVTATEEKPETTVFTARDTATGKTVKYILKDATSASKGMAISAAASYDALTSGTNSENLLTQATFPEGGYYLIQTKTSGTVKGVVAVVTGGKEGLQTVTDGYAYLKVTGSSSTAELDIVDASGNHMTNYADATADPKVLSLFNLEGTYSFAEGALGTGKVAISAATDKDLTVSGLTKGSTVDVGANDTKAPAAAISVNGADYKKVGGAVSFKVQEDTTKVVADLSKNATVTINSTAVTNSSAGANHINVTSDGMVTGLNDGETVIIGDYQYALSGGKLTVKATADTTKTLKTYNVSDTTAGYEVTIKVTKDGYDKLTEAGMSTNLIGGTAFPEAGIYQLLSGNPSSPAASGYTLTDTMLPQEATGTYLRMTADGASIVSVKATNGKEATITSVTNYGSDITIDASSLASGVGLNLTGLTLGSGKKVSITDAKSDFAVTGLKIAKSTVEIVDDVMRTVKVNECTINYAQKKVGTTGGGATATVASDGSVAVSDLGKDATLTGFDGSFTVNGITIKTAEGATMTVVGADSGITGVEKLTSSITNFNGKYRVNEQEIKTTGSNVSLTVTGSSDGTGVASVSGLAKGQSITDFTKGYTINGKTITSKDAIVVSGGANDAVSISDVAKDGVVTVDAEGVSVVTKDKTLKSGEKVTVNGAAYYKNGDEAEGDALTFVTTEGGSALSTGEVQLNQIPADGKSLTLVDGTTVSVESKTKGSTVPDVAIVANGEKGGILTIAEDFEGVIKTADSDGENAETVTYTVNNDYVTVSGSKNIDGTYVKTDGKSFTIDTNYGQSDVIGVTSGGTLTGTKYIHLTDTAAELKPDLLTGTALTSVVYGDTEVLTNGTEKYLEITSTSIAGAPKYTFDSPSDSDKIKNLNLTNYAGKAIEVKGTDSTGLKGLVTVLNNNTGTITLPDGNVISAVKLGTSGTSLDVSKEGVVSASGSTDALSFQLASKGDSETTTLLVGEQAAITAKGAGTYVLGGSGTNATKSIALSGTDASVVVTATMAGVTAVKDLTDGEVITGYDGSYKINDKLGPNSTLTITNQPKYPISLTVTGKGNAGSDNAATFTDISGLGENQTLKGYGTVDAFTVNGHTIGLSGNDANGVEIVGAANGGISAIGDLDAGAALTLALDGVTVTTGTTDMNAKGVTVNGTLYKASDAAALTIKTAGKAGTDSYLFAGIAQKAKGNNVGKMTVFGKLANTTIEFGDGEGAATIDAGTGAVTFTEDGTYVTRAGSETVTYTVSGYESGQLVRVSGSSSMDGLYTTAAANFTINLNNGGEDIIESTTGTLNYQQYNASEAIVKDAAMDVVYGKNANYDGATNVYFTIKTTDNGASYTVTDGTLDSSVEKLDLSAYSDTKITLGAGTSWKTITLDNTTTFTATGDTALVVNKGVVSGVKGVELKAASSGTADLTLKDSGVAVTLSEAGSYSVGSETTKTDVTLTARNGNTDAVLTTTDGVVSTITKLNGNIEGYKGKGVTFASVGGSTYEIDATGAANGVTITGTGSGIAITGLDVDEVVTAKDTSNDGNDTVTYIGISDNVVRVIRSTSSETKSDEYYQLNNSTSIIDLLTGAETGTKVTPSTDWTKAPDGTYYYTAAGGTTTQGASDLAFTVVVGGTKSTYQITVDQAVNDGVLNLTEIKGKTVTVNDKTGGNRYWMGASDAFEASGSFEIKDSKVSYPPTGGLTVMSGSVSTAETYSGPVATKSGDVFTLETAEATIHATQGVTKFVNGTITTPALAAGAATTIAGTTYTASEASVLTVKSVSSGQTTVQTIVNGSVLAKAATVKASGGEEVTYATDNKVGSATDGAGITIVAGAVSAIKGLTTGESVSVTKDKTTTEYKAIGDGSVIQRTVGKTVTRCGSVTPGADVMGGNYQAVAETLQKSSNTVKWTDGKAHYFTIENEAAEVNTKQDEITYARYGNYYVKATGTDGVLEMGIVQIDYLGNAVDVADSTFTGTVTVNGSGAKAFAADLSATRGYNVAITNLSNGTVSNLRKSDRLETKSNSTTKTTVTVDNVTYETTAQLLLEGGDVDKVRAGKLNVQTDTETAKYNNITVLSGTKATPTDKLDTLVNYAESETTNDGVTVEVDEKDGVKAITNLYDGESVTLTTTDIDGSTEKTTYRTFAGNLNVVKTVETTTAAGVTTTVTTVGNLKNMNGDVVEIYSGYAAVADAVEAKEFAWTAGTYDYVLGTTVPATDTEASIGVGTTTSAYSFEDMGKYVLRATVSSENELTLAVHQLNKDGSLNTGTSVPLKGAVEVAGGGAKFTFAKADANYVANITGVGAGSVIQTMEKDTVATAALAEGDTFTLNSKVYTAGAADDTIVITTEVKDKNKTDYVESGVISVTGANTYNMKSVVSNEDGSSVTTSTVVSYTAGSVFDGVNVTVKDGVVTAANGLTGKEKVTIVETIVEHPASGADTTTTKTTTYTADTEGTIIERAVTTEVGNTKTTVTRKAVLAEAGSDVVAGNYNIIGDAYVSQLDWSKYGDSYFDAVTGDIIATVAAQTEPKMITCTEETKDNKFVKVTLGAANTISNITLVKFDENGKLVTDTTSFTSGTVNVDAGGVALQYTAASGRVFNVAISNVGAGANISNLTSKDTVVTTKLAAGNQVTLNNVVYTNAVADSTLSAKGDAVTGTVLVDSTVPNGNTVTAADGTKVTATTGSAIVAVGESITSLTDIGEGESVTVVKGDYTTTYTGKSTGIQVLTNDPTKKSGVIESSTPTSVNVITGTVTAYADPQTLTAFTWDAGGYVVAGAGAASIPGSGTFSDKNKDKTVDYENADEVYIHGTKETDGSYTFVTQKVSALGKLEDTTDYASAAIAAQSAAMKMDVAKVAASISNVAADSVITGVSEDDTVTTQSSLTAGDSITLTDTSGKTHVIEAGGTGSIVINGEGVCTQGTLNLTKDTNGGILATDGTGVAVTKGAVRVTYGSTATIDASTLGNDDVVTYKTADGTERTVSIKQTGDNAYNVTKKEGTSTQIVKNVAASQLGNIVTTGGEGLDWKDAAAVDNMFNWADESSGYFMVTAANFANSKTVVKIADQTTKNTDATNMANVGNYFFKAAVEGTIESGKSLALTIQQMTIQDGLIVMEDVDASKFGGTIQITAPTATGLTFNAGDFTAATIHVVGVSGASSIQGIGAGDTVETAAKLLSDAAVTVNDHTYTVEAGTAKAVVNGTGTAGSGSSAIESGVVTVTDAAVGTASTVTAGSDTSATVTFAKGAATSITNMGAGESVTVEGTNAGTYTMLSDTGVQKGTQVRELSKANANIIASSGWKDVSFDDFKITSKGVGYFLVSDENVSEMLAYLAGEGTAPTSPLTIDIRTDAAYTKPNADGASYAGKYFVQITTTDAKNGVSNISKIALVKLAADGKATTVSSLKLADIGAFLNMTANSSVKFSGQTNVPAEADAAYTLNGLGQVVSGTMSMNSTAKTVKTAAGETIAYTGKDGVTVVVGESGATSVTGLATDKESVKITDANGLVTTYTNNGGVIEEKQGSVLIRKTTESATDETNVLDKTLYTAASFKSSFSFGKSQVGYFNADGGYATIAAYSGQEKSVDSDTVVITMGAANTIASITGASEYSIDANKKALVFDKAAAANGEGTFIIYNVGGKANFQNFASGDTVSAVKGATVTIGSNVYAVSGDGAAFKGDGELTDGTVTLTSGKATYYATVGGKSIAVTGKSITVTAVGGEITSIGGLAAGATFYYDGVAHTVANVDKTLSLVKSDGSTYQTVAVSSKSVNLEDGAITGWSAERAITVPATVTVALSQAAKTSYDSFVYDVTNTKKEKVAAVVGSSYDTTKVAVGTVSATGKTYAATGSGETPAQNITGVADWSITGGAGNDTIAAKGYDTIDGGAGNDSITGGGKYNYYAAGNGNDTIKGFAAGSDTLVLGNGYTEISYENNGKDVKLATSDGSVTLVGMANKEVDIASENGEVGTAHFFGGTGAVKFTTYVDGAYYHGGTGSSLKFGTNNLYRTAKNESETNVNVDLSDARFANINMVDGSGSANRMVLTAGDSAATLKGGSYVSTLAGGSGNDSLVGGSGNDTFQLDSFAGTDTISSYTSGKDVLVTSENFEVQLSTGTDVVLKSGDNSVTLAKAGSTTKPVEIKTDVESASRYYYFGKNGADDTFTYTVAKGSESLVSGISENYYYYGGTAKSKGDTLKLASSGAVGASDITGDGEQDLFTVSLEDNANLNDIEVLDASGLKKTGKVMSYTQLEGSTGSSTLVGGANSVDKFKIADGAGESTNTTIRNFSVDDVIELGTSISDVGSYSNRGTEITLDNGATVNVVGMTKNTYSSLKKGDTQISYTK